MQLKLNKAGDTIIEVLISITILAFALGIAYATAHQSDRTLQSNRERSQATLYANEQADRIGAFVLATPNNREDLNTVSTAGNLNCITESDKFSSSPPVDDNPCIKDGLYKVNVTCLHAGGSGNVCSSGDVFNVYSITVTWPSIMSDDEDKVDIFYGR